MLSRKFDGDARAVGLFVTYLKELSFKVWVDAVAQRPLVKRMGEAEAALRVVLRQLDHHGDIFVTRNAVLDALQIFECAEGRRLTRPKYVTDHLRPATENAALALLVRRRLSADQFVTLYAPFEPVIPSALLLGLPPRSPGEP